MPVPFRSYLLNFATLVSTKSVAITPQIDRQLLAVRSPPRVTLAHPERVKLDEISKIPTILEANSDGLGFKLFHLRANGISFLKEKAKNEELNLGAITSFNVAVAHLWRCKALATYGHDENETSTLLYAVTSAAPLLLICGKCNLECICERPRVKTSIILAGG